MHILIRLKRYFENTYVTERKTFTLAQTPDIKYFDRFEWVRCC